MSASHVSENAATSGASEKVSAAIVHKDHDDDVLIENMRGLLPSWLPSRVLDDTALEAGERELLRRSYPTLRPDATDAQELGVATLPFVLEADALARLPKDVQASVARHYREGDGSWRLGREFVDEMDHVVLMSHTVARASQMSDCDRAQVSRALERIVGLRLPKVSCFTMVMDTTNYFFYRKHHEHVPGIMLIEVVRQAMYAQFYRHGGYAKGQVSLTIENLNVDFLGFVNSNYPVRVQVEDRRAPEQIALDAPYEERVATFSQLGRVVATASMRANPIRMPLFKRLRNVKPSAQARFLPRKCIAPVARFDWERICGVEGRILDVSMGGVKAGFERELQLDAGALAHLSMFVEEIGFISAPMQVRWARAEGVRTVAGFGFGELDPATTNRLREAIKNFTFVDVRRGEL